MNKLSQLFLFVLLICVFTSSSYFAQNGKILSKEFNSNLTAYPFIYYTPETEFAFGAGGVYTFYAGRDAIINPSKISFSGFYATVKTFEFSLSSELFFFENKYVGIVDFNFAHNVDRFFGIGYDTPELGTEEYVMDSYGVLLEYQMPPSIMIADRAGLAFEYRNYTISDKGKNPYLDDETTPGVNGGIISGLGLVYIWDTRDNIFYPLSGGLTKMSVLFYSKDIGSSFTFSTLKLDSRRYWSLDNNSVIAFQSYLETSSEKTPFFKLPALGGSNLMRGYYRGRYRDNHFLAFQTEYRGHLWKKLGFVAFIAYGGVAKNLTLISLSNMKYAGGFGFRFLFNEDEGINLRADFAFGKETNGIYFGIEEAF